LKKPKKAVQKNKSRKRLARGNIFLDEPFCFGYGMA
jgi:hypothetical protein